jgi:photoactive yellow protein
MLLDDVLRNIAEFTKDAVLITTADALDAPDGPRIVYANPGLARMTGYTAEEFIGRTPRLLQGPASSAEARRKIRDALAAGRPVEVEITNYRKSGEAYVAAIEIHPVFETAGEAEARCPAYFVSVQRDITDAKHREDQLRQARDHAERANRAKMNFLSHMSHELRTPLNAIIGFAEMINQQILGPITQSRYVDYAGDIHLSALHLLGIINDVLDFSKIEAGRVVLDEYDIDLDLLLDEVRRMIQGHADRGGITLRIEQAGRFRLRGDTRLLRQVLLNLLSNAVKFTPPGGEISVALLRLTDGRFACVVNDTGVGIPSDKTLEVLEPYVSLKSEGATTRRPGTGLGLPIAKSFMELHGGSLFINSEIGAGTSVFLTMPAERVISGPAPVPGAPADDDHPALPRTEALVLDDTEVERLAGADIDRLPIGVMLLDATGRVLKYNATESRFSGIVPEAALGKNFFTEIAPCTRVSAFHDAFERGLREGRLDAVLSYTFTFPNRPMRVLVQMKSAKEPRQAWVFVRWV